MPIISVSISDSLKKFITKLVSKNKYDNRSKIIRDALLRLMESPDLSNLESDTSDYEIFNQVSKTIVGNMIIIAPNEPNILKKITKIEKDFMDYIVGKNQYFYMNKESITIFMVFEGRLKEFHKIVVEINSIKEIKNFRYLIIN
ncbi:MAG: ribbon-helix-helix protein, CopG family [Candidatus Lokiarchaeota archaeon]|nr:ribbon-helix-helix protein, CopG family [Candidatus Lokiarchaeota archaeon]MBD3343195.1 ribbon-helix-helix protein, CopG family [Candidatus Lokiarchaeota archaeon]